MAGEPTPPKKEQTKKHTEKRQAQCTAGGWKQATDGRPPARTGPSHARQRWVGAPKGRHTQTNKRHPSRGISRVGGGGDGNRRSYFAEREDREHDGGDGAVTGWGDGQPRAVGAKAAAEGAPVETRRTSRATDAARRVELGGQPPPPAATRRVAELCEATRWSLVAALPLVSHP